MSAPEESQSREFQEHALKISSLRILGLRRLENALRSATSGRDDALRNLCECMAPLLHRESQKAFVLGCVVWKAALSPSQAKTLLSMASEILANSKRQAEDQERRARILASLGSLANALAPGN